MKCTEYNTSVCFAEDIKWFRINSYTYCGFVGEIELSWIFEDQMLALFSLGVFVLQINSEPFDVFNT